jgi:hypothetical protein
VTDQYFSPEPTSQRSWRSPAGTQNDVAAGRLRTGDSRRYHRQRLEAAVLGYFRAAMTPPMISTLTDLVNTHVEIAFRERSRGIEHVKARPNATLKVPARGRTRGATQLHRPPMAA